MSGLYEDLSSLDSLQEPSAIGGLILRLRVWVNPTLTSGIDAEACCLLPTPPCVQWDLSLAFVGLALPIHLSTLALLLQYHTLSWNTDPSSRSRFLHQPSLSDLNLSPTSQPFWSSQTIMSCDLGTLFLLPEFCSLPALVNARLCVAGPCSNSLALSSPESLLCLPSSVYHHYIMFNSAMTLITLLLCARVSNSLHVSYAGGWFRTGFNLSLHLWDILAPLHELDIQSLVCHVRTKWSTHSYLFFGSLDEESQHCSVLNTVLKIMVPFSSSRSSGPHGASVCEGGLLSRWQTHNPCFQELPGGGRWQTELTEGCDHHVDLPAPSHDAPLLTTTISKQHQ